jgi:quercetin 2,3-dioxygenase
VNDLTRREALAMLAVSGAAAMAPACTTRRVRREGDPVDDNVKDAPDAVLAIAPLGFPWRTRDPFLFCVHHDDRYPAGNERMGPAASLLTGRNLGQDFEVRDGWRMYHGEVVPGFPQHPHRGFETVTVVRRGLLDHSDSMGATARYGGGDVQWLTAGKGILHAEMFPLIRGDAENPVELFQIWLNLPRASKMVEPYFSMFWAGGVPRHVVLDGAGRATEVTIVAGRHRDVRAPAPPPSSWAAGERSDVAIWTLKLAPGARYALPAAPGTNRSLYFFRGSDLRVAGRPIPASHEVQLHAERDVSLVNGPVESELLLLQGRPIGEPVVQYGPFVMNTRQEIEQAFADYRRTQFGGWPWPANDPVHGRGEARFARHAGGKLERPT